jgi:hypothetical protein
VTTGHAVPVKFEEPDVPTTLSVTEADVPAIRVVDGLSHHVQGDRLVTSVPSIVSLEVAIGFVIAWVVGKARRAGQHLDGLADDVVDAGAIRVRELVLTKLDGDSAVRRMEVEAAETGKVSDRTRQRLELALEEATEEDEKFAAELSEALTQAREPRKDNSVAVTGTATATGPGGSAVGAIGSITGNVAFGGAPAADPPQPGQV